MLKRIITSLLAICVLIPVLIFSDTVVLPIALAIFTFIGLFEMFRCINKSQFVSITIPAYVIAVSTPFILRYFKPQVAAIVFIFGVIYLAYLFALCVVCKGKFKFEEISEVYLLTLYIITAFNAIMYVRDIDYGNYIYLLIFIGAWITDIFAYFTGMLFGKHKLIPEVSPKKTVEGSIGGIVFCTVAFIAFGFVVGTIDSAIDVNYVFLAIGGVLVSIVSQIGDLLMSVIKRQFGVKDYGKLFPGHGGVMDRFDSILAVALMICALCIFSHTMGVTFIGGGI